MEVEIKTAIGLSVERYNVLIEALDQLSRVDFMAQPIRELSDEDFGKLCCLVCYSCATEGVPKYRPRYDLPTVHGSHRCNAHILHLLRSGRTLSQDSMCAESNGEIRWYYKLKDVE